MAETWQFIPVQHGSKAGAKGPDAESRKLVRKAAMRAFRRTQRLEQIKKFQGQEAATPGSPAPSTLSTPKLAGRGSSSAGNARSSQLSAAQDRRNRNIPDLSDTGAVSAIGSIPSSDAGTPCNQATIEYIKARNRSKAIRARCPIPNSLASNLVDPFGCSALDTQPGNHRLYKHFTSVVAPALHPLDVGSNESDTTFAHQALYDPGLLQSLLFHSSVHLDGLYERPWGKDTLMHQSQCIDHINQNMTDYNVATSDSSIAAVSMMAAAGNITEHEAETQAHRNALKKLVSMRGGLGSLGWDGVLEMFIRTGDIIHSTVTFSLPDFTQPSNEPPNCEPGKELLNILQSISELSAIQSSMAASPELRTPEVVRFNKLRSAIEYRLLEMDFGATAGGGDSLGAHILESCRLAALICMNYLFRNLSPKLSVLDILQDRLTDTIIRINFNTDTIVSRAQAEMLLWVFFVGGTLSSETQWFAERISNLMDRLSLESCTEVERLLRGYLLVDKLLQTKNIVALWTTIVDLRVLAAVPELEKFDGFDGLELSV
ncbi:hypothetical protein BP5796_03450 [Coleophoma crateriformis]|uniref:Tachykinin family protein n=1 Tax=Coleophoma crateriformis TaxID=565419 RepID=A0A3D8SN92_9HELO|nr:hypothetical protein BP5796_03450 [Coleophoma crateriformis]